MTVVRSDESAARLLTSARLLLLDFDGPVCAVFAGQSAATVADELRAFVTAHGIALSREVQEGQDPLAVLRYVGLHAPPRVIEDCDSLLTQLEQAAMSQAIPTPGGHEVIRASHLAGIPVVIVSNNSTAAITHYLTLHQLHEQIQEVHGRPPGRPDRMKPDPWLLNHALGQVASADAVFVGDSTSDIRAARRAGVPFIGLANKPGKAARFTAQGAVHVVDDMSSPAAWLVPAAVD